MVGDRSVVTEEKGMRFIRSLGGGQMVRLFFCCLNKAFKV